MERHADRKDPRLPVGVSKIDVATGGAVQKGREWCYRVELMVAGIRKRPRFPKSTPISEITAWIQEQRGEVSKQRQSMTVLAKNSFEWDVEHEYLPQIRHLAAYTERKIDIERWAALFKGRNRNTIKVAEIRKHISAWAAGIGTDRVDRHGRTIKGKKLSASTLNHRLSALSNFYELLNGKRGYNPVAEVERFQEEEKPIRVVSEAWMTKIVAELQPNVTGARLRCLIYTGMRPKQLERVQREDIDLEGGRVWVRAAKGGRTNLISLPEAGVSAFRDLIRFAENTELHERFRHKWGQKIAQESANAALRRAAKAAGYTGPLTRYVFRHSFATLMLLDKGASTRQVQQQLTHSSLELVERYTKVQQSAGTKAVMAKIG